MMYPRLLLTAKSLRLSSGKALTLTGLALALVLSNTLPASAGTWQIVYTVSGSGNYYPQSPYSAQEVPLPSGPVLIEQQNGWTDVLQDSTISTGTYSPSVSATYQATLYWIPANSADAPPANIIVEETADADGGTVANTVPWSNDIVGSGTADDGLGDATSDSIYYTDSHSDDDYTLAYLDAYVNRTVFQNITVQPGTGTIPGTSTQYTAMATMGSRSLNASATANADLTFALEPPYYRYYESLFVDAAVDYRVTLPGNLNGSYLNQDSPGASGWSSLSNPSVLYGGSEPSTSDSLWLQAGDPYLIPGTTYTWFVYGPGSNLYTPPATSTNPNWVVGPLKGIPSLLSFQCLLTYPDGSLATKQTNVEVGIRTDDVALVGWIDKLGVPGGATGLSTTGVNPQIVLDLPPAPPFGIGATERIGELSCNNDHTDYDESNPATIMSAADRDYCLDWMFIYASNPDPATVAVNLDQTIDQSMGWNGYSDFRNPAGFMDYGKFYAYVNNGQNYKLVNHFQVKYRVNPTTGTFNGLPTILHQDTLVGTTINPATFPPAVLIPAQQGPMNSAVLIDPNNTYISLVNDGSPDVQGIRAFNTLEALDTGTSVFWENIGSGIEFMSPGWGNASGWAWHRLPHQPYPTYNLYLNGMFSSSFAEAPSPTKNFTAAPYPFGTVPNTFGSPPVSLATSIPGGRNGDAQSPPDPSVNGPSSGYTHLIS